MTLSPAKKTPDESSYSGRFAARLRMLRDADTNLRTTFLKIIAWAGVAPWPKLFQNLRAFGATDFAGGMKSHVAAAACGHTEQIAREHCWQVTDADMDEAIKKIGAQNVQAPADPAKKVAQKDGTAKRRRPGQSRARR